MASDAQGPVTSQVRMLTGGTPALQEPWGAEIWGKGGRTVEPGGIVYVTAGLSVIAIVTLAKLHPDCTFGPQTA